MMATGDKEQKIQFSLISYSQINETKSVFFGWLARAGNGSNFDFIAVHVLYSLFLWLLVDFEWLKLLLQFCVTRLSKSTDQLTVGFLEWNVEVTREMKILSFHLDSAWEAWFVEGY